ARVLHPDEMLHGAREATGDVHIGFDRLSGLTDLLGVGDPSGVDDRPGGTGCRLERFGESFDQAEVLRRTQAASTGHDHGSVAELRAFPLLDVTFHYPCLRGA